jgi:lysophospholipase L1-like esterase
MKIFVLGDSISIHYGEYLETYLKNTISYSRKEGTEQALEDLDQAIGANGGDSNMVLEYLQFKMKYGGIDADLLLVNCGLHDIKTNISTGLKQVSLDKYKDNLKEIISISKALNTKLIWIRTTPCDEKIHNQLNNNFHRFSSDCDTYNKIADQVMVFSSIPVIDLYTFTKTLSTDLYCDHIHMRDDVRKKQAEYIANWLINFELEKAHQEDGLSIAR